VLADSFEYFERCLVSRIHFLREQLFTAASEIKPERHEHKRESKRTRLPAATRHSTTRHQTATSPEWSTALTQYLEVGSKCPAKAGVMATLDVAPKLVGSSGPPWRLSADEDKLSPKEGSG